MNRAQKIAVGIIVGVPVVCCLGGILTFQKSLANTSSTLDGDLKTLRAHRFPIAPEDLGLKKPESPAQNAGPLYTRVAREFGDVGVGDPRMKRLLAGFGPKAKSTARADAEKAFAELQAIVALAEDAADRPACYFVRDWNRGFALEFPEFSAMKNLSRLLCYKAERQNAQGDPIGALRSIARAQRIARHADSEGFLIGALVSVASETAATYSLRRIIDDHGREPKILAAAQKVQDGFGPLPSMRRTMASELVLGRIGIQKLTSMRDITVMTGGDDAPSALEKIPLATLRGAFEARLVREYALTEPSLPEDPERWPEAKAALLKMDHRVSTDDSPLGVMNQILLPVSSQAADAIGKLQAERRLTETSIRLLQARLKGPLPKKLPGTANQIGDPFSKNPLRYLPSSTGGFTLYSVGADGTDDGGKVRSGASKTYDIVAKFR